MFISAIVLLIIGLMSMISGETNSIAIRLIGQFKKDELKAKNEANITADVISLSLVFLGICLYIISKIF